MGDENPNGEVPSRESLRGFPSCHCKVGQIAREYDLEGIDAELTRRWRGEGVERQSLRTITDFFNSNVFRSMLEEADADILEAQVEHLYEIVTGDTATEGERAEVTNRLQRAGIDVDEMQQNQFVSYQTIHNHLRDCLGVPPPTSKDEKSTKEADQDSLRAIRTRTERIAESMVDRNVDETPTSLSITVNVMARCDECGYNKPVTTLLEEGGCYCDRHGAPDS